jgi:metal-sulfur cluster biosynthetic enzyme
VATSSDIAFKSAQVRLQLERVTDPELDESVIEMDFVTRAEVDAQDRVHIEFRLPTYWCAANFAFMMADDMRAAVLDLPWVKGVIVRLGEHMYAETINHGMAEGLSFQEAFGREADGDLSEVRRTFLLKAFQRRQEALLLLLRDAGWSPVALASLSLADLVVLPLSAEARNLVDRYIERRAVAGPAGPEAPAFVTAQGETLPTEAFEAYLGGLRRVRVNAEFNGALCRGLLSARFDTTTPLSPKSGRPHNHP